MWKIRGWFEPFITRGYTPNKVLEGYSHNHKPLFINSIPKSGTNLLQNFFISLPAYRRALIPTINGSNFHKYEKNIYFRKNCIITGHIPMVHEVRKLTSDRDISKILLKRNLKAIVLSNAYYLKSSASRHSLHHLYKGLDLSDAIDCTIMGANNYFQRELGAPPLSEDIAGYIEQIETGEYLQLSFEELVDSTKEVSEKQVPKIFKRLAKFCENPIIEEKGLTAMSQILGKRGRTLRRGETDAWKIEFSSRNTRMFSEHLGELNNKLGYEC